MKSFELPDGTQALVDDDDYESVYWRRWVLRTSRNSTYITNGRDLSLHRFIMRPPPGMVVDHINHDIRDNRRSNLRVVTQHQNMENRKGAMITNRIGVRGVSYRPERYPRHPYHVRVRQTWIGQYATLQEATEAAVAARRRLMTCSQN